MGAWFSSNAVNSIQPEKTNEIKIMIRHRPTCLSNDIEQGIAEEQDNLVKTDTKL